MADPFSMAVALAFVISWFTPTPLFLFLNLLIGTLVVTSRFTISFKDHHRHRARGPYLLDRVKSIDFSQYYSEPESHRVDPSPPPSLLMRLKSVNFSSYRNDHTEPVSETVHHGREPEYTDRVDDHPQPLTKTPSLLQLLKPFNFPSWENDPNSEPRSEPGQKPEYMTTTRPDLPLLARVPSFLKRVKSINFSLYGQQDNEYPEQPDPVRVDHLVKRVNSDTKPSGGKAPAKLPGKMRKSVSETVNHGREPEYTDRADDHPQPLTKTPSLLQRLKPFNFPSWENDPNPEPRSESGQQPEYMTTTRPDPPPLARVPSFLKRVNSINFSLYGQQDNEYPAQPDPVHVDHLVKRVNSDTMPSGGKAPAKLPGKMRKSASHRSAFGHFGHEKMVDDVVELRRRPESVREGKKKAAGDEEEEGGEHIDAQADDFINKFRQELKLQRLDSIIRYKDLVTRAHANN